MGFGMLIVWVLLFLAIIAIGRATARAPVERHEAPRTALQVLAERYARGEIGKAEFEAKKRDLADSVR